MGIMVQDLYHQQKASSKSVEVIQLSQQTALQKVAAIANSLRCRCCRSRTPIARGPFVDPWFVMGWAFEKVDLP